MHGEGYLADGKLNKAASALQQSLDIRPKLIRALLGQARLAMIKRDLKLANDSLTQVLSLEPGNAIAWSLSGDLAQLHGDNVKAEKAYSKSIENSFEHSVVQLKRVLLRIELDDYADAASDVKALKKTVKDFPGVNYAEGLLSFRQKNVVKAEAAFSRVLSQQPGNMLAVFYLGASNYVWGNMAQAENYTRIFHEYARLYPQGTRSV